MPKPPISLAAERLGAAVREARLGAELSQNAAAKRAGLNVLSWRAVELGRRDAQPLTLSHVEQALRWPAGTCQVVLGGGHPPLADPERAKQTQLDRIERKLDALGRHFGIDLGDTRGPV